MNGCIESLTFEYLNKENFSAVSNVLFSILADNMEKIAPTGNTRKEDYKCWYDAVSDGLTHAERQIILINHDGNIIGFFQYYTNSDTFVMEEIQLASEYKGKGAFRKLYGFMIENLNNDIEFVEAYANIANDKSILILEHIGLVKTGMNKNGCSFRFRGKFSDLLRWFNNKGE